MLKGPGGFPKIVNGSMNIVICLCMSLFILASMQNQPELANVPILMPIAVLQSFVLSFCVGYSGGDLVPAMTWGQKIASGLNAKSRLGNYIITSIVLGVCMGVVITLCCSLINNITTQGMAGVWGFFISKGEVLGHVLRLQYVQ